MHMRNLSKDLTVSAIGYGAMGLSEFYGAADDKNSIEVLRTVIESGVNFIDTADIYGRGHNEQLIGQFLASLTQSQRSQIIIATKCGIYRPIEAAYARSINNEPDYIRRCCHASLQRLGVERIDLFYLHRVNPQASIEESMSCLSELVKEGKIAHIGLCEVSAATLEKAVIPVAGTSDLGPVRDNFYVIHHTTMPAVLIETAFISNPHDAALLASPAFLQNMEAGIASGADAAQNLVKAAWDAGDALECGCVDGVHADGYALKAGGVERGSERLQEMAVGGER